MHKLIATYKKPADVDAFERHYRDVHTPLVQKIPGLLRTVLNRGITPPWGGEPGFYLLVEMQFANEEAFLAAMNSPENRAAGKDIRNFAADLVTLSVAKVEY